MRDYADEANLHARIYAMRSRFFSLKDYVSLARNPEALFAGATEDNPDPVAAKEIIFREQIAPIIPLTEAARMYAPLFLAFYRQFEVHNAKLILAKAFGLQSLKEWYDIGPYATLERSLLRETITLEEIRPILTGTYLADVLRDVSSYRQMEIHVDICGARNLYAASALFTPEAKREFQELMGRRIAVVSTILAWRLKKSYQWDDEKIRLFQKFHDVSNGKAWKHVKIVEEELNRHLEKVPCSGAKEPSTVDIENYLDQYYYNWISSVFHRDFHSIHCVVAYLWLLYYQIRNLFRIIEGKRFGFSVERILDRIVCGA